MKKNIHPKYNSQTKVTCSCGNTFLTGSTVDEIVTDLCSNCHPFYTGEQKIVDTENRVAKFEAKRKQAKSSFTSKREKMAKRKQKVTAINDKSATAGLTLKDMLTGMGTAK